MEKGAIIAENAALKSEVKSLKSQLQLTEARLMLLTQKTFQKKSEKHNDKQTLLPFEFNEAEVIADATQSEEEVPPSFENRWPFRPWTPRGMVLRTEYFSEK